MTTKYFDEHGLIGNSGLVPGGHVSVNFSAGKNMVFVSSEDFWNRKPNDKVEPSDKIITCYHCDKPAISLDHFYPYHNEFTYCEDHKPS